MVPATLKRYRSDAKTKLEAIHRLRSDEDWSHLLDSYKPAWCRNESTFLGEGTALSISKLTDYATEKYGAGTFDSVTNLNAKVLSFRDAEKVHQDVNSTCNLVLDNLMTLQTTGSLVEGVHQDKSLAISAIKRLRVLADKVEQSVLLPPPVKVTELEVPKFDVISRASSKEVLSGVPAAESVSSRTPVHSVPSSSQTIPTTPTDVPSTAPMHTLTKAALIRLLNAESIEVEDDGGIDDDALALACRTVQNNIKDPEIRGERMRWIIMTRFRGSPVEYQVKLMRRVYLQYFSNRVLWELEGHVQAA